VVKSTGLSIPPLHQIFAALVFSAPHSNPPSNPREFAAHSHQKLLAKSKSASNSCREFVANCDLAINWSCEFAANCHFATNSRREFDTSLGEFVANSNSVSTSRHEFANSRRRLSKTLRQADARRRFSRPQSAEKCSDLRLPNNRLDPDAAHFYMAGLEGNMTDRNIPSNDGEFNTFQAQFMTVVTADPAKYGLYQDEVTALQAAQAKWSPAYDGHVQAQEGAHTASANKDAARTTYEGLIRAAAKKMSATAGVDNAARIAAGLAPHAESRSHIGAPSSRPVAMIEPSGSCTLIVNFADEQTPHKNAKPHGVQGCQVWLHVGDPAPADPSAYSFLGLDTRTPYTDIHPAADAGKTAYYLLRWQTAKGETGPWSAVVSAKIPF
jgi:hypothetical protein